MRNSGRRRIIAAFFLLIFSVELLLPSVSYALTSGPAQPEMQSFSPAGASDLVDLFTGDLNYNIPLLDVGGYPVNLSYQSGTTMEEEASWVGTGWTLNPGSLNRTLRGLPDELDGSKGDVIKKEYSKKEFKKVGGEIVVKGTLFGWETSSINASVRLNVYKDNYYGIGASVGASLGYSLAKNLDGPQLVGLGLGIESDTRDGVDINPSFSLSSYDDFNKNVLGSFGLSGGLHYNTRAGLKSFSLGASFSPDFMNKKEKMLRVSNAVNASFTSYFGQSYTPSISSKTSNSGFTFNFDLGPSFFGIHVGFGGAGYTYKERLLEKNFEVPAYGYMNYLKGRKDENAILDFNREKDGVFLLSAPSIPIPVATNDFWTATGQTGSQQFRPYFGGNYVVFDRMHNNVSNNVSGGVTLGGGNLFLVGGHFDLSHGESKSGKWRANNHYLASGEPAFDQDSAHREFMYFKQVGEKTEADEIFYEKFGWSEARKVAINDRLNTSKEAKSFAVFKSRSTPMNVPEIKKLNREIKVFPFSYLNAEQASKYALEQTINGQPRVANHRKAHHLSEVTVTDNQGKRMVYGIPVYNLHQEEVSFAVNPAINYESAKQTGLIDYTSADASAANNKGRDNMYSKEKLPAYPTSFLLTGILSPDYVDREGDGITDDDLGTAIEFKYSKLSSDYKWRAPYAAGKANYNEGFDSDKKDDRASFVYGEKEVWYLDQIISKTMIAIFERSDREDGLGVLNNNGGKNVDPQMRLKKLDRIKLYSLADYLKNNTNAVPIKIVHFEYDYSLYPKVPNNTGNALVVNGIDLNDAKGKLTLKKVYFTFGTSTRGTFNPYEFEYDLRPTDDNIIANLPMLPSDVERSDIYRERQSDRWSTYKRNFYNRLNSSNQPVFNNSEFPYSLQENTNTNFSERELADLFASKWQLNKIITPTGGVISVEYESDDYAFVQNKRAMQMCFVKGIQVANQISGLPHSTKIVVELPKTVSGLTEFKELYLKQADGRYMDKLFYKFNVDLDNRNHFEYVHGYAELDLTNTTVSGDGKTVSIGVKKINNYNPVAYSAWQMMRNELPQFAYDSYDNTDVGDGAAVIRSIIAALGNLREIAQPFEQKAINRDYANKVNISKSLVRLMNPDGKKIGGGLRVKKVEISDEWSEMTQINDSKTSKYGQVYDYSIRDEEGNFISSSGVAAYEPQIGNEENPFHEPVSFTEKVHWSNDKFHYIEKPYCESYFPAAGVGYSKVTVTSFGNDYAEGGPLIKHTGYIENDFYTARDFPTIVDVLPLDQVNYQNSLSIKLFSSTSANRVATSQGFRVELNDMHGKPKFVKVFNKGGAPISSSEYFYSVKDQNAQTKELDNDVDVLDESGNIRRLTLGVDAEFTTDTRENKNESIGTSIGGYKGALFIPFFLPVYIPYIAVNYNKSVRLQSYNSICAVQVIHRYGILKKTRTIQNGSTMEAENLLWDGNTGEALLTRTQTEHEKNIYSFNYPAHMVADYEGMGAAYYNLGIIMDLTFGSGGNLPSYDNYLFPGDELVSLQDDIRAWVIKIGSDPIFLIDKYGTEVTQNGSYMVIRSGRRNHLNASTGSIISMNDPRTDNTISLDVNKKILDAKAVIFRDLWNIPMDRAYYDRTPFCDYNSDYPLNPFHQGLLGNWRPYTSHVYTVNRSQPPGDPNQQGGTDIRNSGYYSSFNLFWEFTSNGLTNSIPIGEDIPANDNRWIWTNKPVYFDQKGNVLESVDPLGRFSAAMYGYLQSLPLAIGSNSEKSEIFFDGFEDYNFNLQTPGNPCPKRSIDFEFDLVGNEWVSSIGKITDDQSHTGKYSYYINDELSIITSLAIPQPIQPQWPEFYREIDGSVHTQFIGMSPTFRPQVNKKYLMSVWINDNSPTTNTIQGLQVTINGVSIPVSSTVVPVVEGWKRLEIPFQMGLTGMSVTFDPSSNVYIDDLRFLPFDGQINSYVYDETNLRLTAQLDENNFATFYEYDEEGTPIRIKKETERGIMTLKENRQTFRRR